MIGGSLLHDPVCEYVAQPKRLPPKGEDVSDRMARTDVALALVRAEIARATAKHPKFNSHHEGYAILLEEVDELWDDVKADRHDPAALEAIQVAAMAIRLLVDCSTWDMEGSNGGSYPNDAVPVLRSARNSETAAHVQDSKERAPAEGFFTRIRRRWGS